MLRHVVAIALCGLAITACGSGSGAPGTPAAATTGAGRGLNAAEWAAYSELLAAWDAVYVQASGSSIADCQLARVTAEELVHHRVQVDRAAMRD